MGGQEKLMKNCCLFVPFYRLVGFDELGGTDGFSTALLEFKLANAGECV
jgi:hypothetical protein